MTDARPIPPAELFEHAEFLKHLARRLLKDEHLAEDVAQETLIAALEHPPREHGALRAWLARTAHNLALNRRTAAGRRERHEQAAARPEREDAQQDALERLELQRTVFEQVLSLDEAKRAVLFLRYHEGLTPADIAARLGVPVKTVKTRLARGLEELRARLERRYEGDRRALGLALATLARGPVLATTTALVGGGLAMKWMLGTAAAIVLWLTWQGTRGAPAAPRELARIGDTVLLESPDGTTETRRSAPAMREAQASVAEPRPAVYALTGTVRRREDGSALAGVALEAWVYGPRFERLAATTDEAGRYRIERNGPVSVSTLTVAATPTTTSAERTVGKRLAADEPLVVDLWVTGGASLSARVVDEQGRPVRGATVRAWCSERFEPSKPEDRRATSAGNGAFTLEHLGERFVLFAEAPGLACLYGLRGHLTPGVDVEGLEVVMSEAKFLRGHVVDERGQAIAGAELHDAPHLGSSDQDATQVVGVQRFYAHDVRTTTGSDGAFALGPVPQGWIVRVTHPAFLYADAALNAELEDNRIELAAGYALRGVVLGADGRALPGAEVHVRPQPGEERQATTDAAGRFEVHALSATENGFVHVSAPGHAVLARQPLAFGPDAPSSIELRLEPETPLAGRVVDASGRPVVDALVRAEGDRLIASDTDYGERTTWEWKAGCNQVRTDAEGRFRFAQLYPGDFQLLASPPDAPELRAELRVRSGREDVELVLDRAALERVVFTGTVRDARTHEPLHGFGVCLMHPEAGGGLRGNTRTFDDAQGGFRLAGNEPGSYDVRITAPGYAGWIGGLTEYREGEQRIEAELWPTCVPTFTTVDERGRALYARLVFHDLDGRRLLLDMGTYTSDTLTTVDAAGTMAPGLPTSVVRVTATAGLVETVLDVDLTVPPVAPIQIVLTSDPQDVRVSVVLALLETDDAKLAESSDTDLLKQAFLDGRAAPLARSAEIDFLDDSGRPFAHAVLERVAAGKYFSQLSIAKNPWAISSSGPELHLDLPLRATVAVIRAPGCVERRLALALERDRPSHQVLALLLER